MSRTAIKQAIQTALANVGGLKKLYTYFPREQSGMVFPSAVIAVEKQSEKPATLGNSGRRRVHYQVTLYIQTIASNPREDQSQQAFDDMLDNIDTALRADYTLGGAVLQSAWNDIDTDVFTPTFTGQGKDLTLRAIKNFDVLIEITG